mmetsp:Transcript_40013/g.126289  ORF Transcript_40013/g.126289 Transcript_40013/m.126289 type:complete len:207 (+) Transcript_40013:422-1042(+)
MLVRQREHQMRGHCEQPSGPEKAPRQLATPWVQRWHEELCRPPPGRAGSVQRDSATKISVRGKAASPPSSRKTRRCRFFRAERSTASTSSSSRPADSRSGAERLREGCTRCGGPLSRLGLRAVWRGWWTRGPIRRGESSPSPSAASAALLSAMFFSRWSSYSLSPARAGGTGVGGVLTGVGGADAGMAFEGLTNLGCTRCSVSPLS